MSIKSILKYSYPIAYLRILSAKMLEAWPATKYLATAGLLKKPKKMATDLTIRAHALEKGMSIGSVRVGFGQQKALSLMHDIDIFLRLGGGNRKASEWLSIVSSYINFNEQLGADMTKVRQQYDNLLKKYKINISLDDVGLYWLDHDTIREDEVKPFRQFSQSRYSVRDFGKTLVDKSKIEEALKLCERTPSACNRQSWRLHIYTDRQKIDKLCKLQLGCKGFYEDMQGVILISSDLTRYGFQEINQCYVDGGIYAMNMLYALHANDIAAIPLTMAHKTSWINKIKREMSLPRNEQPIILIGYGSYKDKWKVAKSKRESYKEYVRWNC